MTQQMVEVGRVNGGEGRFGKVGIGLYGPNSAPRQALESFIADKYRLIHRAELDEFLPLLCGVKEQGEWACAAGFRPGLYRPMFLEQYLDSPIEQQVAAISKQPVDRCSLVEIGNLAVTRKGYGPLMMVLIASALAGSGYEWMVFTVTEQVERLIARLGFKPHYLAGADANRLRGDKSRWGSYYDNNPRVMVGHLPTAMKTIRENPWLAQIYSTHQNDITALSHRLSDYRRLGAQ